MREIIRIGSRESKLAQIQARLIQAQIQTKYPDMRVEIITMKTSGDKILTERCPYGRKQRIANRCLQQEGRSS